MNADKPARENADRPACADIGEQADVWAARRGDRERWTEADEAELRAWLAASPRHRRAFERAAAASAAMDALAGRIRAGALPADQLERVLGGARQAGPRPDPPRRRWAGRLTVAAAAALIGAVGALVVLTQSDARETQWVVHRTDIGRMQSVNLPDGSRLDLDAATRIRYAFCDSSRRVQLTAGRSAFTVDHDPGRPFTVTVPDGRAVRVTGTVFSVALQPRDDRRDAPAALEVTVAEGSVEARSASADPADPAAPGARSDAAVARLTAGQRITWLADQAEPAVQTVRPADFAAWRDGRLVYRNEPLANVVADLDRYFRGEIRLTDPALADEVVSGSFEVRNLAATLRAFELTMPVEVDQPGPQVITISPAR